MYTYAPPKLTETVIRGKPKPFSVKVAFASAGAQTIELVQPIEGHSIWNELLDSRGDSPHHVACYTVEELERALALLEKHGIGVLQSAKYQNGDFTVHFAYVDTQKALGVTLELVEMHGQRVPPEEIYPPL